MPQARVKKNGYSMFVEDFAHQNGIMNRKTAFDAAKDQWEVCKI